MGNYNKTEADFAHERYAKMGGISPEQDVPTDDIRLVGTETAQSVSEEASGSVRIPIESPFASHNRVGASSMDTNKIGSSEDRELLSGDPELAADVWLNASEPEPVNPSAREDAIVVTGPAPGRDELLNSDARLAAEAAGLEDGVMDCAADERTPEGGIDPLEDIPDADNIQAGSPVDPVSPRWDAMPGTDVLNGRTGEDR